MLDEKRINSVIPFAKVCDPISAMEKQPLVTRLVLETGKSNEIKAPKPKSPMGGGVGESTAPYVYRTGNSPDSLLGRGVK
jgi:hypothetical protein